MLNKLIPRENALLVEGFEGHDELLIHMQPGKLPYITRTEGYPDGDLPIGIFKVTIDENRTVSNNPLGMVLRLLGFDFNSCFIDVGGTYLPHIPSSNADDVSQEGSEPENVDNRDYNKIICRIMDPYISDTDIFYGGFSDDILEQKGKPGLPPHCPVASLTSGMNVAGFYILNDMEILPPGFSPALFVAQAVDKTGSIKITERCYSNSVLEAKNGCVAWISGDVVKDKNGLKIIIGNLRICKDDEYNTSELVPIAPINTLETLTRLLSIVCSIEDDEYRFLVLEMLWRHREAFIRMPVAKQGQYAFLGGLLMHTANMLELADSVRRIYKDTVSRSLLLAGVVLHDMGKVHEFKVSSLGLITDYLSRNINNNTVLGIKEVKFVAEQNGISKKKTSLLCDLLLPYRGLSKIKNGLFICSPEAELLNLIEACDTQIETCRKALCFGLH